MFRDIHPGSNGFSRYWHLQPKAEAGNGHACTAGQGWSVRNFPIQPWMRYILRHRKIEGSNGQGSKSRAAISRSEVASVQLSSDAWVTDFLQRHAEVWKDIAVSPSSQQSGSSGSSRYGISQTTRLRAAQPWQGPGESWMA